MKAWILEKQMPIEKYPLQLKEAPKLETGAYDIRIKNIACGVCRTDIHIAEGVLPMRKSFLIPGYEIVGIVDKIGGKVINFKVGDKAGVVWLNNTYRNTNFRR